MCAMVGVHLWRGSPHVTDTGPIQAFPLTFCAAWVRLSQTRCCNIHRYRHVITTRMWNAMRWAPKNVNLLITLSLIFESLLNFTYSIKNFSLNFFFVLLQKKISFHLTFPPKAPNDVFRPCVTFIDQWDCALQAVLSGSRLKTINFN